MLPYVIVFSISTLLYKFSLKNVSKSVCFLCLFSSVLLLSFLAGLRDETVGWDWRGYGITIWSLATKVEKLKDFIPLYPSIEIGYKILNFIVAGISHDYHVFYFFHQLILATIAVSIASAYRKQSYSEYIFLFYLLFLFNPSMTMLRQAVAMMLSFAAFAMWDKGRNKCSYVFSAIACLFHFSAVFAFFIYVIFKYADSIKKYQKVILVVLSLVLFLTVFNFISVNTFFSQILSKLIDLHIISTHYAGYVDQTGDVSLHKTDMLFQGCIIIMMFLLPKGSKNKLVCFQIFLCAMFAIVLNLFGNVTDVAFRVAYYFIPPIAILMPKVSKEKKVNQKACLVFFLLLIVRLLYFSQTNGAENTVPYVSCILGV